MVIEPARGLSVAEGFGRLPHCGQRLPPLAAIGPANERNYFEQIEQFAVTLLPGATTGKPASRDRAGRAVDLFQRGRDLIEEQHRAFGP